MAGKYYVPKFGAFVIYTIMIIVLLLRPQGLFARASGSAEGRMSSPVEDQVAHYLAARARWRPLEYAFWLAAVASVFLLPGGT